LVEVEVVVAVAARGVVVTRTQLDPLLLEVLAALEALADLVVLVVEAEEAEREVLLEVQPLVQDFRE
jgi:hypothetical protein